MPTSPSAAAGLFAGRYAIERALGQGATATVHLALDNRTGERVAIKMLRPELAASGAADRFLKEIAHTESLKHPGILEVLDSGQHEGQLYFTLPYMEGGTLRMKLKRERQLSLDDTVTIVSTIAEALDYAHVRGLVHRDVKPENILFTEGRACLGDFGIARALQTVYGDGTTSSATIRGTPAYMSPEQAAGAEVLDGRSDVFSLACVAYEMVTGMQAFMGPTPESVVAQRFAFTPREIRAYRPAAPTSIDQALARAFTLSPADRYPTAGELARALEAARAATPVVPVTPAVPTRSMRGVLIGATVVGALLVGALLLNVSESARGWLGLTPKSDTTRVAILPFDNAGASLAAEDLLSEGLRRYRGLAIVETFATADAVRQRGSVSTLADARAIALSLGAGRYVRGRMTASGDRALYAALYDSRNNTELYHARVQVPPDSSGLLAAYAALADSLILRGSREGAPVARGTASLPAIQAFLRGRGALSEWNLPDAQSWFSKAIEYDPASSRARLWLAQVRAWKGDPPATWRADAVRGMEDSTALSADERSHGAALALLASDEYEASCAAYRRIVDRNPKDFAGWFGLGECHRADHRVVADNRSPSGFRFRASYYQAMLAYQRAFEVFPSSYRGYQSSAYQPLQQLLFAMPRLRQGVTNDSAHSQFLARAAASGDTVVFVPYLSATVVGGAPIADTAATRRAVQQGRSALHRVASSWSAALPDNAGTKEALAISLEIMGDLEAAIDTAREGRRLASDSSQRLRLATQEALLMVQLGISPRGNGLERARALADSVSKLEPRNAADAELLLRLAVLLGRCRDASRLALLSITPGPESVGVPPGVVAAVQARLPGIALGCEPATALPSVRERLAATPLAEPERVRAEYGLIGVIVGLGYPENPRLIQRLAHSTFDYVLVIEDSLLAGNVSGARRMLGNTMKGRSGQTLAEIPPDAALTEARLWLAVGDTTTALSLLDRSLDAMPVSLQLGAGNVAANIVRVATLCRALVMRADLAAARGAPAVRWARPVAQLWSGADPELQTIVRRMKDLSSR